MPKRKNKSKKEIVIDIKAVQETDRLRTLMREQVYPFLLELNDSIGFSKVFLQVCAVTVESAFNNTSKEVKVSDLMPKLKELYKNDTEENKKYLRFFELFKDETVSTFVSLIEATPRHIERYFTQEIDKKPILDMPIDKILG